METWIDENGKKVQIAQFIPQSYFDEQSRELDSKYNIWLPPKHIGHLGKSQWESTANALNNLYYAVKRTMGIPATNLDEIGKDNSLYSGFDRSWTYSALESKGFLRTKKIKGIEVLFPTEELIKRAFSIRK